MNKMILLSAGIFAGGMLFAQGPGRMPVAVVEVGKVTQSQDFETRHYTGLIVSQSSVQIVPRVSGEILEVGFKDGSVVKKGQILYRLDSTQYEATVKSCEAKIAEWKAKLEYARNNYNRSNTLYEKQAASRDSMENTKSTLEAYQASLLSAEADLITAKDNLKNTTITAPLNGIVGVTAYTAGNYITPNSGVLITIIQVQPIRVRFSLSTGDFLSLFGSLENLKKNGSVKLRLSDGTRYPAEGAIEFINNEANRKTDAIQVYANFPNTDFKLLVGSTVGVTLSKKTGRSMPAVPPSAIMYDGKGAFVYVPDKNNIIEKRYVATGNATSELQLIESGLKPGETVVTKGTHKTMHGGKIEPVVKEGN